MIDQDYSTSPITSGVLDIVSGVRDEPGMNGISIQPGGFPNFQTQLRFNGAERKVSHSELLFNVTMQHFDTIKFSKVFELSTVWIPVLLTNTYS